MTERLQCGAYGCRSADGEEILIDEGEVLRPAVTAWVENPNIQLTDPEDQASLFAAVAERTAPAVVVQVIRTVPAGWQIQFWQLSHQVVLPPCAWDQVIDLELAGGRVEAILTGVAGAQACNLPDQCIMRLVTSQGRDAIE